MKRASFDNCIQRCATYHGVIAIPILECSVCVGELAKVVPDAESVQA